jgi:hypothetical protein
MARCLVGGVPQQDAVHPLSLVDALNRVVVAVDAEIRLNDALRHGDPLFVAAAQKELNSAVRKLHPRDIEAWHRLDDLAEHGFFYPNEQGEYSPAL